MIGKTSKDSVKSSESKSFFSSTGSLLLIIILVFAFKSSILDANNIPSGSMIPTLKIGDFLFVNKMRYSLRAPFTEKELIRYDDPQRGDIVTFAPPPRAAMEDSFLEPVRQEKYMGLTNMFSKRFVKRVVGLPGDTIRIEQRRMKNSKNDIVEHYAYLEYKPKGQDAFKDYNAHAVAEGAELSDLDNDKVISEIYANKSLFKETKRDFEHFVLEGSNAGLFSIGNYPFLERLCGNLDRPCEFEIPDGSYMVMGDNRDDSSDSRVWGLVKREDILGKALIIYFSVNWKDNTCRYKMEKDSEGNIQYSTYEDEEILKHCHPSELNRSFQSESLIGWLDRTIRYRIWRMEVRWKRIGRILK